MRYSKPHVTWKWCTVKIHISQRNNTEIVAPVYFYNSTLIDAPFSPHFVGLSSGGFCSCPDAGPRP